MSTRIIPKELIDVQSQASDPAVSAWVSANAGAGKTHVLAQRVIRLLLDGVDPAKILCLTFTKAAAANMANRVFTTLAEWTSLGDDALDRKIASTGAKRGGGPQRARARRLFASALDTPGGLKVQTIHGFCAGLLQQFPFEANVAARFRVMESVQQQQLLEEIRLAVLIEASNDPDGPLGKALATCVAGASDFAFQTALAESITEREHVLAWHDHAGSVANLHAQVSASLGIDPNATGQQVEDEFFNSSIIPKSEWPTLVQVLNQGTKADQNQAKLLTEAIAAATDRGKRDKFVAIFLTADDEPRQRIITKGLGDRFPVFAQQIADERDRLAALVTRQRAVASRDRTVALLTIADTVLERYRAAKDRRGLLDYDDLIARTRAMLDRVKSTWVHFKLDLGIDHVLIDEAQDTSPAQWEIISKLVAEFTVGAGARGGLWRSLFAVGDDKQSIFSFQGAAPEKFDEMLRFFEGHHVRAGLPFERVRFLHSFRSVPLVLDAVDTVFAQPQAHEGLSADRVRTAHTAVRAAAPGIVELWPLVKPDEKAKTDQWDAPFDTETQNSPRAVMAGRIAAAIKTWIARGDLVGDDNDRRPISAGDILILVRQRGPLFEAIIRALKNERIPVAGADRLILTEHIAVMDLLALADTLMLPQDDLTLATVLKSPLFGFSETQLYELAVDRKGSLRAALREKHPDVASRLDQLAAQAQQNTPFAFFADVLGPGGGRKAFVSRLGHEANDALDEFLNLTLDYESREVASLQGFVTWLRTASAEIKRDMEMVRDEVRVMTVHGAKGLEAPVVILTDTTSEPSGPPQLQRRLLPLSPRAAPPGTPDRLVWVPNKAAHINVTENAANAEKSAAKDEHRRLLYVAMTRAADRLVVCGEVGVNDMRPGCWYELVEQGLSGSNAMFSHPADYGEGEVLHFRKAGAIESKPRPSPEKTLPLFPGWLNSNVPAEPQRYAIKPSSDDSSGLHPASGSPDARRFALLRGVLAHRLLQSLPEVDSERRRAVAETFLARSGKDLPDGEHASLLAQVFAVLDDNRFAPLFAPGSRGEVPIVGRIAGRDVTGQVDRLAVTKDTVLIADYKTNRPPPRLPAEVPFGYRRQLALYRELLAKIYPNHNIRCALVWTEVPDLMELPADMLDDALNAATSS